MTAITTARLTPDPQRFPPGTAVRAYRASAWSGSDRSVPPTGAADAGPVNVAADGSLTFAGLTDQTTYFAYAASAGPPVRFATRHDAVDDAAAGTTSDTQSARLDYLGAGLRRAVEGRDGLVAGWFFDQSSGTVLNDAGPNAINLTKGAAGTVGAAPVVPEFAASLQSASGGASAPASVAVAAGSPLQISGPMTFMALVKMGTPGSGREPGGRVSNWSFRAVGGAGVQSAHITIAGVAKQAIGRVPVAAGQYALLVGVFDGREVVFAQNAAIEARLPVSGSITATTDQMEVGSRSSGNTFDGFLQAYAVFNRAMSIGEIRSITRSLDVTLDNQGAAQHWDLAADATAIVAASAATRFCGFCSAQMRVAERQIARTYDTFHPGCWPLVNKNPQPLVAGSSAEQYSSWSIHMMREALIALSKKSSPTDTVFYDTRWNGSGFTGAPSYSSWEIGLAMGVGAAMLARLGGSGEAEPFVAVAKAEVARLQGFQADYGAFVVNGARSGTYFAQMEYGMMLLALEGVVADAQWRLWRGSFLRSVEFMRAGGGGFTAELDFYTNGNFGMMGIICYALAYRLTGDPSWQTTMETQIARTITPPAGMAGNGPGGLAVGFGLFDGTISARATGTTTSGSNVVTALAVSSGAFTVGKQVTIDGAPASVGGVKVGAVDLPSSTLTLVKITDGTAANLTASTAGVDIQQVDATPVSAAGLMALSDTTGKAYLAECSVGNTPGLDWNYLLYQADLALRWWQVTGDARAAKLLNVFRNKLQDRLNRATWVLDAVSGTRVNTAIGWNTMHEHVLALKLGRSDISGADLAGQITTASTGMEASFRTQWLTSGQTSYFRGYGTALGAALLLDPGWPGFPAMPA